jgi:hypothetical protein
MQNGLDERLGLLKLIGLPQNQEDGHLSNINFITIPKMLLKQDRTQQELKVRLLWSKK